MNINFKELNVNGPIVIGVSSGSDSMALFHYCIKNYKDKIICAHINHNVRKQSIEEEKYLKEYCQKNNIIFETMTIKSYKENNFENEARKIRYKFYEEILKKYNSHYLLLAHHADDLIETILMKITRGSNINGYAGIKKISKINNYYIVRPLLDYTKEEILNYIKDNNIKYYEDDTNKNTLYTRNRFRLNILPLLKQEDKNIHKKFIKYSQILQEYNDYINYETDKKIKSIYKNNKLNINKFIKLHPFMQKNIIYSILNNLYNNKENIIKEQQVENIIKLINNNKPNLNLKLPNNLLVTKEYSELNFTNDNIKTKNYKYKLDNEIIIDNHIITKINNANTNGNDICKLNSKNIKLPLYIRNKKNGDYIEVLGLNGKKKVKDIFIEKKIPTRIRNNYPLLVDANDNILWIPNIKKSKFNTKNNEKYDIILKYKERKDINE